MGYTVNSIIIKKEINELFEIINDVRNWPELHNYQDVKILEKKKLLDGRRKIVFQVTGNKEEEPVEIWTSQRIIDVTNMCARGVRLEPILSLLFCIQCTDLHFSEFLRGPFLCLFKLPEHILQYLKPVIAHTDRFFVRICKFFFQLLNLMFINVVLFLMKFF